MTAFCNSFEQQNYFLIISSKDHSNRKYNSYIRIGNATPEFVKVLNKIWLLADPAHYCNGQLKFDWEEGLHSQKTSIYWTMYVLGVLMEFD